jgi:hypothetical protein
MAGSSDTLGSLWIPHEIRSTFISQERTSVKLVTREFTLAPKAWIEFAFRHTRVGFQFPWGFNFSRERKTSGRLAVSKVILKDAFNMSKLNFSFFYWFLDFYKSIWDFYSFQWLDFCCSGGMVVTEST